MKQRGIQQALAHDEHFDQAGFVAANKANIPAMGKEAEQALEGPEGDGLRDAEAAAAGRSRDTF